jgi:hypothetical protein
MNGGQAAALPWLPIRRAGAAARRSRITAVNNRSEMPTALTSKLAMAGVLLSWITTYPTQLSSNPSP